MSAEYTYDDIGYRYSAVHRQMYDFDPRNTDNILIIDYMNTKVSDGTAYNTFYAAVDRHLNHYINGDISHIPISFSMAIDDVNIAWVDLITQMILIENAVGTFVGEYADQINKVVINDNQGIKESLVYRYPLGESIFHIAAYLWLYDAMKKSPFPKSAGEGALRYIEGKYSAIESAMGERYTDKILGMCDFEGVTMRKLLQDFIERHSTENVR
jgi:hypothetical protein